MSDYTSKYHGYLGIPNEGSGIRIYLENETDSVEYTTTGENLTDFLDNLYGYTHGSLDNIVLHMNDYNNPHHVTSEQVGAVSLTNDEIISGNKSFTGKVVFSNTSFNQNISLENEYTFSGNGAGLTNLYIPNLVYTNEHLQKINGSLVLSNNDGISSISVEKNGNIGKVSVSNNGSILSLIGSNNKEFIIDTNMYTGDVNTSNDSGLSIAWKLNNMSTSLNHVDNSGLTREPNIAEITLGTNYISPREQYPISLGTKNSAWNHIYCDNVIVGNSNRDNESSIYQFSNNSSIHLLRTGDDRSYSSIEDVSGNNFSCRKMTLENSNGMNKSLLITTNSMLNANTPITSDSQTDSMTILWSVPNISSHNNMAISLTNSSISPVSEYSIDLGDATHYWNNIYTNVISSNKIELNGIDVSSKIHNSITNLPSNLVVNDSTSPQILSSGLVVNQSATNNPSFTITDPEKSITVLHGINSIFGGQSLYQDIESNKELSIVTKPNICDSKNIDYHKSDTILYWKCDGQSIKSIDTNNTESVAKSSAVITFSDYSIKPERYFPIDLGTNECRWRTIYSNTIDADSIILSGNDLKTYIDKSTSMDKFYELERKIDDGDTASIEKSKAYTDSEVSRIIQDYTDKINSIDLSVILNDEIKAYID